MKKIIFSTLMMALLAAACNKSVNLQTSNQSAVPTSTVEPAQAPIPSTKSDPKLTPPIGNSLSRVTKKPFGIYITPQNSPVQPEKFKGYHTGVDFETTADEQ